MNKKAFLNLIVKSSLAGLLIGLAGWAYLICLQMNLGDWNKVIGSFVFSIGLVAVILLEAKLFTGVIGYVDSKEKIFEAIIILIVNLIVAYLAGVIYRFAVNESTLMLTKVNKSWWRFLLDSIGCGACIFIAVEGYKKTKSIFIIVLAVMVFILAGFEHTIADIFYLGAGKFDLKSFGYILLAALGNSIGGLGCRWLELGINKIGENKNG